MPSRCICAAALLIVTAMASAGAGEASHDGAHPPAAASDEAAPGHGEHPPLDRHSKLGAPDLPDMRAAPAVPQIPRLSARDRLFRLMQTARPRLPARLHPLNPAVPSTPVRNAIGVRIDTGAAARTTTMPHWSQSPTRAGTGATPMAAPPSITNAWRPGAAVPAPAARGALNGTALVHRGSGAPVIGGPAKTTTGINGTTLRPKHQ